MRFSIAPPGVDPPGLSRKALIRTCLFLVGFCSMMWTIPIVIEQVQRGPMKTITATDRPASWEDPAVMPQTIAEWVGGHGAGEGEAEPLVLVGAADPEADEDALLDEAEANRPLPGTEAGEGPAKVVRPDGE